VYRVDRFSRNLGDLVGLLDELDQAGVVFRSATEPFDTATPMGRMLVQMLGMFAQFERETIIDRVIAGMERKAAAGKWKGGRRPFGYTVNKQTHTLRPHPDEAAIVRRIFALYTGPRHGTRAIARILNEQGHRTTQGGIWSGYQVLRALSNRIYLGELSFRDITTENCHEPIIDTKTWDSAQAILDARGENHSHRASSGYDYLLTGRLRCPKCGKAMLGTRATGRNRTYRYYTCFTRARYDTSKCDFARLDADEVDTAVLDALADFYRNRTDLITQAIEAAQHRYHVTTTDRKAELDAVNGQLGQTNQAIDRYLSAFENGTLDEELLADRLADLQVKAKQLRRRKDELALAVDDEPTAPEPAALEAVADHITDIIANGTNNEAKALIEALIERIDVTGPDRLQPTFRIPQPAHDPADNTNSNDETAAPPAETTGRTAVRTMTNLVDLTCHNPNRLTFEGSTVRVRPTGGSLTPADRVELIDAFGAGATTVALAERYGVSRSTVKTILREHGVRRDRRAT
ncbi:MAG: recombinase family protein, partial [Stackebrandtia sp.]